MITPFSRVLIIIVIFTLCREAKEQFDLIFASLIDEFQKAYDVIQYCYFFEKEVAI